MNHKIRNILLGALLSIGLGVPYLQAADVAISALPAGSALGGTEAIPMVQGAATKKTTPLTLKAYMEAGGTVAASDPVLDLTQTWNSGAVTFIGLKLNITDTASASGSLFADFLVGGSSKASIAKSGTVAANGASIGGTSLALSGGFAVSDADIETGAILSYGTSGIGLTGSSGAITLIDVGTSSTYIASDASDVFAVRNFSSAQTLRVYDTHTNSTNYGRIALNTSLTGDWVQVAAETAGTGADNYGIALTPTGTGAISVHVPDSTAAGGNARGTYAVDLQMQRSAATQVASGANSFIAGYYNTASGVRSVALGFTNVASGAQSVAFGNSNGSSNDDAVSFGRGNTASGRQSLAYGRESTTRGLTGTTAYSAGMRSAVGDAQVIIQPVRRTTTDATPVSLATDGTPAAATVMVLPASSTLMCMAMVVAQSASAANNAGYEIKAVIQRDGSNNTALVGTATTTTVGEDTAGMDATIIANDTLESAEIQVAGVAATTIQWMGELKCVQVL